MRDHNSDVAHSDFWNNPPDEDFSADVWLCSRFDSDTGLREFLGEYEAPADVDGWELYEYMEEAGWIDGIQHYDCDGDNEHIAVIGKTPFYGDFSWDFIPVGVPQFACPDVGNNRMTIKLKREGQTRHTLFGEVAIGLDGFYFSLVLKKGAQSFSSVVDAGPYTTEAEAYVAMDDKVSTFLGDAEESEASPVWRRMVDLASQEVHAVLRKVPAGPGNCQTPSGDPSDAKRWRLRAS